MNFEEPVLQKPMTECSSCGRDFGCNFYCGFADWRADQSICYDCYHKYHNDNADRANFGINLNNADRAKFLRRYPEQLKSCELDSDEIL